MSNELRDNILNGDEPGFQDIETANIGEGINNNVDQNNGVGEENQAESPNVRIGNDGQPIQDYPQKQSVENTNIGSDGLPIEEHLGEHEDGRVEVEDVEIDETKSISPVNCVFNLLSSLMGSGILSVPNSFVNIGVFPSIILMFFIAALSWIATYIVLRLQKIAKTANLEHMTYIVLGRFGTYFISILNLMFLYSCLLGFLIIGGDMVQSWFELGNINVSGLLNRAIMIFVYSLCIPIALTFPRSIRFLSKISFLSVLFVFLFCVVITIKGIIHIAKDGVDKTVSWGFLGFSLFSSIAIYGLSFALPLVFVPAISLYHSDIKRRSKVTIVAMVLCYLLVCIPGVFGYLSFGANTQGNVLKNFSSDDIVIIIVRSGFFFIVSIAYPLVAQSLISSWSYVIFKDNVTSSLPLTKRLIVLSLTNLPPLLIAAFLSEAKPALAIGGAFGGCLAQFTLPSAMYIKTSTEKLTSLRNISCIIFALFGIVAGVISTYQAILDAISAFSNL